MTNDLLARVARLSCWSEPVHPRPVSGGLTNANFAVDHAGERFFVRIGADIPLHGVMRFNEVAASQAAHAAGISPDVVHVEPGALVLRFIDGQSLTEELVRSAENLPRVAALIARCHREVPRHFRGPALVFWVFQVIRDYAASLAEMGSRMIPRLAELLAQAEVLERLVGPVELVFGHNDLVAANIIDDGARLWLIDWDYAGFNSPLFDLGGLASNNGFSPAQEESLLETYYQTPVNDELRGRYRAMKCASLLREAMWSMVAELVSEIDYDFVAYTDKYLARFDAAFLDYKP